MQFHAPIQSSVSQRKANTHLAECRAFSLTEIVNQETLGLRLVQGSRQSGVRNLFTEGPPLLCQASTRGTSCDIRTYHASLQCTPTGKKPREKHIFHSLLFPFFFLYHTITSMLKYSNIKFPVNGWQRMARYFSDIMWHRYITDFSLPISHIYLEGPYGSANITTQFTGVD